MCDMTQSRDTQIPGAFHIICFENLTFHKTIRNKRLLYRKNTIKNTNLHMQLFFKVFLFTF